MRILLGTSAGFLLSALPLLAVTATQMTPHLPVLFERNTGDTANTYPLEARGKGYALLLGRGQVQLRQPGAGSTTMRFAGAANLPAEPLEPSATLVNDYTGPKSRWTTGAPTWQQAEYRGVYPGIDLLFYGNNGEIEYDARIQPGSDPKRIAFTCEGADPPRVNAAGDLLLPLGKGTATWHKPSAYQTIGNRRVAVDAWFTVKGRRIGFGTGAWDHRYPLTIDPTLTFSTFLGGSGSDFLRNIAVDASGNIYIVGSTSSGDLPVTASSYQSAYKGGTGYSIPADAWLAKLNPAGTAVTYITYLGGTGLDWGFAIATDSSGAAYVTGFTDSTDFPITASAYQKNFGGDNGVFNSQSGDAFATKFDTNDKLVWSTYLGGNSNEIGSSIAVDSSGNVYIAGSTQSSNYPVTPGVVQGTFGGGDQGLTISQQGYVEINLGDGFVSKLDPTGSKLLASTFLGGSGDDVVGAITLDSAGNVWVGGIFRPRRTRCRPDTAAPAARWYRASSNSATASSPS